MREDRKRRNRNGVKVMLFMALCAGLFLFAGFLLQLRSRDGVSGSFYEAADSYDVIFTGPSTVVYGIQPMLLWQNNGILSFNLATTNQEVANSYYLCEEAVRTKHPKLLVVDVGRAFDEKLYKSEAQLHLITDNLSLFSTVKYRMIRELLPADRRAAFYCPLFLYHERWKGEDSETEEMYKPTTLGALVNFHRANRKAYAEFDIDEGYQLPENVTVYLERLISLCEKTDTELLLIAMPFPGKFGRTDQAEYEERVNAAAAVERFAEPRGVAILNFLRDDSVLGLDVKRDTIDGKHLNYWGAEKLTAYLGSYIAEHYGIEDKRGNEAYAAVDAGYADYTELCERLSISTQRNISGFVNAILDYPNQEDLLVIFAAKNLPAVELTEKKAAALMKLGIATNFYADEKNAYVAVIEAGSVVYETGEESEEEAVSAARYSAASTLEEASIVIDGKEMCFGDDGISVAVYDTAKREVLDECTIAVPDVSRYDLTRGS